MDATSRSQDDAAATSLELRDSTQHTTAGATWGNPSHLVPAPEVHGVLAVLCSHEVVMAQLAEAVAAAAVGLVLRQLRARAQVPAGAPTVRVSGCLGW